MTDHNNTEFKTLIMPHLTAAYNYAYWLTSNAQNAEDLTQEAFTRALAAFGRFRKQHPKAWLMTIVRNAFYNQQQQLKRRGEVVYLDNFHEDDCHSDELMSSQTPEQQVSRNLDVELVRTCINYLSREHREVIMLREIEGFSYEEMSKILECPLGTVMSRLSRARNRLKKLIQKQGYRQEDQHEM